MRKSQAARPIRILVVDDHPALRQGVRSVLEEEADFQVVGEADDGADVLPLVERQAPDVLLLDLALKGTNGMEVMLLVRQRAPRTRVLVYSMFELLPYVAESIANGALGYVLKSATPPELKSAVREVMAGRLWLSPPFREENVREFIKKLRAVGFDAYRTLTRREREVFRLVALGHNNPRIADLLGISRRTVESHRANFGRKLGIGSDFDILKIALLHGILCWDDPLGLARSEPAGAGGPNGLEPRKDRRALGRQASGELAADEGREQGSRRRGTKPGRQERAGSPPANRPATGRSRRAAPAGDGPRDALGG